MSVDGSPEEREPLLIDDESIDRSGAVECQPQDRFAHLPVFETIHRIRHEVMNCLEDPYTLDQLRAPRINASVVRPLANRLFDLNDISVVYCLLVNKLQFIREQDFQAHQTLPATRAHLCELAATKILRRFDEESPGQDGLLFLSHVLVAGFQPFQNAPADVIRDKQRNIPWGGGMSSGGYERKSSVLELAIISESKMLISTPSFQKVMDAIYVGRITYTPSSFIDILPDYYKHKPITIYHPEQAPMLNQYRLMVPRTRTYIDIGQFCILLLLYLLTMYQRRDVEFTIFEMVFCIYGLGWILDELASVLEHGWQCYTQNLWSFLDAIFAVIFSIYFVVRMHGLAANDDYLGRPALDILAAGAPVLVPRLAFNFLSENMLFVCLRAMMSDFTFLTLLAGWCFAGFLLSMYWLGERRFLTITIAKWMLYVWFGLDGTGVQKSVEFHWFLGPLLMVTFAFLGNTLFLTILVSMLTSTYSKIAANATAEIQFRRAVLTFEGVKADAIFSYQPPFNVLALGILLPLKLLVSPRWFHKVNVTAVRIINAPVLVLITYYERRHLWKGIYNGSDSGHSMRRRTVAPHGPWSILRFWDFSRFSVHADTEAVFDYDPPNSNKKDLLRAQEVNKNVSRPASKASVRSGQGTTRKDSFGAIPGFPAQLSDYMHEHLHEHLNQDLAARLEAVEASSQRIETMLRQVSRDLGDDDSSEDMIPAVVTRTHES